MPFSTIFQLKCGHLDQSRVIHLHDVCLFIHPSTHGYPFALSVCLPYVSQSVCSLIYVFRSICPAFLLLVSFPRFFVCSLSSSLSTLLALRYMCQICMFVYVYNILSGMYVLVSLSLCILTIQLNSWYLLFRFSNIQEMGLYDDVVAHMQFKNTKQHRGKLYCSMLAKHFVNLLIFNSFHIETLYSYLLQQ